MPRETIRNPKSNFGVEVGWLRDGETVQVASVNYDEPEKGWYVEVSRDDINRLIRALRRARDQAFGADE